jgi:hypothetical protein
VGFFSVLKVFFPEGPGLKRENGTLIVCLMNVSVLFVNKTLLWVAWGGSYNNFFRTEKWVKMVGLLKITL